MLSCFLPILATSRSQSAKEDKVKKELVVNIDKRRAEKVALVSGLKSIPNYVFLERGAYGCGPLHF